MEDEQTTGRLIGVDSNCRFGDPESAALNMALDQALLSSVDQTGIPCLRLYRWSEPTLSLGYFQSYEHRQAHQESLSSPCVRRASGGGAIVHHHELTYSIAIADDHPSLVTSAARMQSNEPKIKTSIGANAKLYALVHDAIRQAISEFGISATPFRKLDHSGAKQISQHNGNRTGNRTCKHTDVPTDEPFLCFRRRTSEDLIVAGYKILGSAQRRGKRSLLQHGSLLVRSSPHAPQLPGLIDLGAKIDRIEKLAAPIVKRIRDALSVDWSLSTIEDEEQELGMEIANRRFLNTTWTHRR